MGRLSSSGKTSVDRRTNVPASAPATPTTRARAGAGARGRDDGAVEANAITHVIPGTGSCHARVRAMLGSPTKEGSWLSDPWTCTSSVFPEQVQRADRAGDHGACGERNDPGAGSAVPEQGRERRGDDAGQRPISIRRARRISRSMWRSRVRWGLRMPRRSVMIFRRTVRAADRVRESVDGEGRGCSAGGGCGDDRLDSDPRGCRGGGRARGPVDGFLRDQRWDFFEWRLVRRSSRGRLRLCLGGFSVARRRGGISRISSSTNSSSTPSSSSTRRAPLRRRTMGLHSSKSTRSCTRRAC